MKVVLIDVLQFLMLFLSNSYWTIIEKLFNKCETRFIVIV